MKEIIERITATKDQHALKLLIQSLGSSEIASFNNQNKVDNWPPSQLNICLIKAAKENDTALVLRCLALGADSGSTDLEGNTGLHFAVQFKNREVISAFLHHNIDEHAKNKLGNSAIDYANTDLDLSAWFIQCSRAIRLKQLFGTMKKVSELDFFQRNQASIVQALIERVEYLIGKLAHIEREISRFRMGSRL